MYFSLSLSVSLSLYIYIYIYLYICIYCYPQTDCLVLSEPFSVASRDRNPSNVRLSLRTLGQQAYHVWPRELLRYLCSNISSRTLEYVKGCIYLSNNISQWTDMFFGQFCSIFVLLIFKSIIIQRNQV